MGYSSQVAYLITGDKEVVLPFIAKLRLVYPETAEALADITVGKINEELYYIAYSHEDIKWYSDYEYVESHAKIWDLAAEMGEELSGSFRRIGEDAGDIEERDFGNGDSSCDLSISRQINLNVGLGKDHDIRLNGQTP